MYLTEFIYSTILIISVFLFNYKNKDKKNIKIISTLFLLGYLCLLLMQYLYYHLDYWYYIYSYSFWCLISLALFYFYIKRKVLSIHDNIGIKIFKIFSLFIYCSVPFILLLVELEGIFPYERDFIQFFKMLFYSTILVLIAVFITSKYLIPYFGFKLVAFTFILTSIFISILMWQISQKIEYQKKVHLLQLENEPLKNKIIYREREINELNNELLKNKSLFHKFQMHIDSLQTELDKRK